MLKTKNKFLNIKYCNGISFIILIISIFIIIIISSITIIIFNDNNLLDKTIETVKKETHYTIREIIILLQNQNEINKIIGKTEVPITLNEISKHMNKTENDLITLGYTFEDKRIYYNKGKENQEVVIDFANYIQDLSEGTKIKYNDRYYKILYDGKNNDPFSNKVEIVSLKTLENIKLIGKNDYINAIDILNKKSQKYLGNLAIGARSVGSDPSNPNNYSVIPSNYVIWNTKDFLDNSIEKKSINQTTHEIDCAKMKSLKGGSIYYVDKPYWLASRNSQSYESYTRFYVHNVNYDTDNDLKNSILRLYSDRREGKTGITRGLRVILAFSPKQKVKLIEGSMDTYYIY